MVEILTSMCIGYFLGSIPFALVIGKVFYHTDIRQYGSKNLGGGNAGRVLGKKAGLSVMTLDILKVTLAIFLCSLACCTFGRLFPLQVWYRRQQIRFTFISL